MNSRPKSASVSSSKARSASIVSGMAMKKEDQHHVYGNSYKDAETLNMEVLQMKKKFVVVQQDNTYLKAQVQRLATLLRKKDKQMHMAMELKSVGTSSNDRDGENIVDGRIRQLKSEMLSISTLTEKVRELEASSAAKDEELKVLKSSMKFTLIKELQLEAQAYFEEARRMKKILDAQQQQLQQQAQMQKPKTSGTSGSGTVSEAGNGVEVRRLKEELKRLYKENIFLKNENISQAKSLEVLNNLRSSMSTLHTDPSKGDLHGSSGGSGDDDDRNAYGTGHQHVQRQVTKGGGSTSTGQLHVISQRTMMSSSSSSSLLTRPTPPGHGQVNVTGDRYSNFNASGNY